MIEILIVIILIMIFSGAGIAFIDRRAMIKVLENLDKRIRLLTEINHIQDEDMCELQEKVNKLIANKPTGLPEDRRSNGRI